MFFKCGSIFCGFNLSNNTSIPKVREIGRWQDLWNFLTINPKDKSFHNFVECSGLYLKCVSPMVGGNLQIYIVQITRDCIWEPFPPPWHDMIIILLMKNIPCRKRFFLTWKGFLEKKYSLIFWAGTMNTVIT